jgi:hypothetical protein
VAVFGDPGSWSWRAIELGAGLLGPCFLTRSSHGGDEPGNGFGHFYLSSNHFCHLTVAVGEISFNFKGKKKWTNQTMKPLLPLLLDIDAEKGILNLFTAELNSGGRTKCESHARKND